MKHLRSESGSILVFVTLVVVVLLVMVAMGLDTGWVTFSRSMGQRAVDMAALAGSAGLAKGDVGAVKADVEGAVNDYVKVSSNAIDGTAGGKNVTLVKYDSTTGAITAVSDIANANGVRVALEKTNPYTNAGSASAINTTHFLMPLLNYLGIGTSTSTDVNVSAVAVYTTVPGIPIALGGCTVGPGQHLLQTPSGGSNPNNSGWTTYTFKETNTKDLKRWIKAILSCQGGADASIGTPICLANGQNSPVVEEFGDLADLGGNTCYFAPVVAAQKNFNGCTGDENVIQSWAKLCITKICAPGKGHDTTCEQGQKYIEADIQACDLDDSARVGQCFKHSLVRETKVGM